MTSSIPKEVIDWFQQQFKDIEKDHSQSGKTVIQVYQSDKEMYQKFKEVLETKIGLKLSMASVVSIITEYLKNQYPKVKDITSKINQAEVKRIFNASVKVINEVLFVMKQFKKRIFSCLSSSCVHEWFLTLVGNDERSLYVVRDSIRDTFNETDLVILDQMLPVWVREKRIKIEAANRCKRYISRYREYNDLLISLLDERYKRDLPLLEMASNFVMNQKKNNFLQSTTESEKENKKTLNESTDEKKQEE